MFRRLAITAIMAALTLTGLVTAASAATPSDRPNNAGLSGLDLAAESVDNAAAVLHVLGSLPGATTDADATCDAVNLLRGLAGQPASNCGKKHITEVQLFAEPPQSRLSHPEQYGCRPRY